MQARRDWREILQVIKSKDLQPKLLFLQSYLLELKDIEKSFPDYKKKEDKEKTKGVNTRKTYIIRSVKGISLRR